MKCARCKRPLSSLTASVPSRNGLLFLGPKCARLAGWIKPRQKVMRAAVNGTTWHDPNQLPLELGA